MHWELKRKQSSYFIHHHLMFVLIHVSWLCIWLCKLCSSYIPWHPHDPPMHPLRRRFLSHGGTPIQVSSKSWMTMDYCWNSRGDWGTPWLSRKPQITIENRHDFPWYFHYFPINPFKSHEIPINSPVKFNSLALKSHIIPNKIPMEIPSTRATGGSIWQISKGHPQSASRWWDRRSLAWGSPPSCLAKPPEISHRPRSIWRFPESWVYPQTIYFGVSPLMESSVWQGPDGWDGQIWIQCALNISESLFFKGLRGGFHSWFP